MERKESPKTTGISDITGKIVRVRHANEFDMVFIEEMLKKYHLDTENLHYSQFVIATENGNLVGLGRLKKTGGMYEIGCVAVVGERKGQGIGSLIVKHLIDYAPLKIIYVITDQVDYFKKLGFLEIKEGTKELESLDKACKTKGKNTVILAYEKPGV